MLVKGQIIRQVERGREVGGKEREQGGGGEGERMNVNMNVIREKTQLEGSQRI